MPALTSRLLLSFHGDTLDLWRRTPDPDDTQNDWHHLEFNNAPFNVTVFKETLRFGNYHNTPLLPNFTIVHFSKDLCNRNGWHSVAIYNLLKRHLWYNCF